MSFRYISLAICLALTLAPSVLVLAAEPARILIRDVSLINRQEGAGDAVANMLITDGQLEVITKDSIEYESADLIVDGKGGFLLGTLEIGTPPSFVILDEDPRGEIEVLFDTKTHVQFAVKNGEIVVNNLPQIVVRKPDSDEPERRLGWLAYEPPPLALSLSYQNGKKWNRFESKYVNGLASGGLGIDRTRWLSQDGSSMGQVGDLSEFDGGEIRALRFGLAGTLNFESVSMYSTKPSTNGFTKGFDTNNDDDFTMFDYRLDIPVLNNTTLSIGKQKEPISLERLTGMVYLPWQERTAAGDAMFPSRNHGIVINGMRSDGWMTWAGGAFNNWIDSDESFDDTANQLVGRVTWVPLVSDDESNLLHLGFGLRRTDAK